MTLKVRLKYDQVFATQMKKKMKVKLYREIKNYVLYSMKPKHQKYLNMSFFNFLFIG